MQQEVKERTLIEAEYIIQTGATVRATASVFHVGKSTVHKDVTERLVSIDKDLSMQVRTVLEKNLKERHIRGGLATKRKFLSI